MLESNLRLLEHLVIGNRPFGPIPLFNPLLLVAAVDHRAAHGHSHIAPALFDMNTRMWHFLFGVASAFSRRQL